MYLFLKKITLISLLLFLGGVVTGQNTGPLKTIYLYDGSFLYGKLIKETRSAYRWQLTDGTQITFSKDQVRKIKEDRPNFRHLKNGKIKRFQGFYFHILGGELVEKRTNKDSDLVSASTINLSVGYYLNSKLSVGIGTGHDNYDLRFIPVFAEVRGDLFDKVVTPYYKLAVGYGFAQSEIVSARINVSNGVLVHPSIGLKFATRSKMVWMLDFGYRFQRYNIQNAWESEPQRWTYQRTSFRLGLEF